ncbi:hypothetical protein Ancab_032124 [Ancistrocladus abbreviatus]
MGYGSKQYKIAGASGEGHRSPQWVLSTGALMEDRTTTSRRRDKLATSEHPLVNLIGTNGPGLVCSKTLTTGDLSGPCNISGCSGKSPKGASVAKRVAKSKCSKPRNLSLLNKKKRASNKSPVATGTGGNSAISRDSSASKIWDLGKQLGACSKKNDQAMLQRISVIEGLKP